MLGGAANGCKRSPQSEPQLERLVEQHLVASDAWYRAAWGEPLDDVGRAGVRDRLRCVWGELRRGGHDPVGDLTCQIRRTEAAAACYQAIPTDGPEIDLSPCTRAFEEACPVTPAFEAAAARCKAPAAR